MTVPSRDGIPIHCESRGSGETALVLVHGWSCDRTYWNGQLDAFATAGYRVVTLDLAGHGASGGGRKSWTMEAFGEDVVAVVEALGLRRVVLVGHSMGGDVIVPAALRLGRGVAGLVWVDVYGRLGTPRPRAETEAFAEPFRQDFAPAVRAFVRRLFPADADPALVARVAEDMAAAPKDVAIAAMIHARSNDGPILAQLRELRLRGVAIVAIQPEHGATDVESLAGYGVKAVFQPGVGHFPMLEAPEAFNTLLARVLRDELGQTAGAGFCTT